MVEDVLRKPDYGDSCGADGDNESRPNANENEDNSMDNSEDRKDGKLDKEYRKENSEVCNDERNNYDAETTEIQMRIW